MGRVADGAALPLMACGHHAPSGDLDAGDDGHSRPQPLDQWLAPIELDADRDTLHDLGEVPVALSGGSRAKVEPLAGERRATRPRGPCRETCRR